LNHVAKYRQLCIEYPALTSSKYALANGISKSTFWDWLEQVESGELHRGIAHVNQRCRLKMGMYPQVETMLINYMVNRLALYPRDKLGLSFFLLQLKAAEFAKSVLSPEEQLLFLASMGWVRNCLFRAGYQNVLVYGEADQIDPVEADKQMDVLRKYLVELTDKYQLSLDMVINADQTSLFYRQLPNSLFCSKEDSKKYSGVKAMTDKERVTIMVATTPAGSKLPMYVVGTAQKPFSLRQPGSIPHGIHYVSQSRG
jgi:hypothetical protein